MERTGAPGVTIAVSRGGQARLERRDRLRRPRARCAGLEDHADADRQRVEAPDGRRARAARAGGPPRPGRAGAALRPGLSAEAWPITTRQLAGHLAGIRHYKPGEFESRTHYDTVRAGLIVFENDALLFEPGTKFSYSSYGWNLLSAVLEGASGEKFLDLMQKTRLRAGRHDAHGAGRRGADRAGSRPLLHARSRDLDDRQRRLRRQQRQVGRRRVRLDRGGPRRVRQRAARGPAA